MLFWQMLVKFGQLTKQTKRRSEETDSVTLKTDVVDALVSQKIKMMKSSRK